VTDQHCHTSCEIATARADIQNMRTVIHHVRQQLQRMSMLHLHNTSRHISHRVWDTHTGKMLGKATRKSTHQQMLNNTRCKDYKNTKRKAEDMSSWHEHEHEQLAVNLIINLLFAVWQRNDRSCIKVGMLIFENFISRYENFNSQMRNIILEIENFSRVSILVSLIN